MNKASSSTNSIGGGQSIWLIALQKAYVQLTHIFSDQTPLRTQILWATFLFMFLWFGFLIHRAMIRHLVASLGFFKANGSKPAVPDSCLKVVEESVRQLSNNFPEMHKRVTALPKTGWKFEVLKKRLEKMATYEADKKSEGKFAAKHFDLSSSIVSVNQEGSSRFLFSNILFYNMHASSLQIDNELISMCSRMLGGKGKCTGVSTTSQLESHLLTLLAYKRYFLSEKGITEPEVIMADTAHPSFAKACEIIQVKAVIIKTNEETGTFKPIDMMNKVNSNTILVICSAPNSVNGTLDPVEEISVLAKSKGVCLHVDATYGGFIFPFLEQAGFSEMAKKFDFSLEGVTSMTLEPSCYGGSPLGISVLLFSEARYQKAMYWGTSTWCGYLYGSSTFLGSKGSNFIAAGWSSLLMIGAKGYTDNTKLIVDSTKSFVEKLNSTGIVKVIGNPQLGIVSFKSANPDLNIFALGSYLELHGWSLIPLVGIEALQLIIHKNNALKLKELILLIKKSIDESKKTDKGDLVGRWSSMSLISETKLKSKRLAEEIAREYTHKLYCL